MCQFSDVQLRLWWSTQAFLSTSSHPSCNACLSKALSMHIMWEQSFFFFPPSASNRTLFFIVASSMQQLCGKKEKWTLHWISQHKSINNTGHYKVSSYHLVCPYPHTFHTSAQNPPAGSDLRKSTGGWVKGFPLWLWLEAWKHCILSYCNLKKRSFSWGVGDVDFVTACLKQADMRSSCGRLHVGEHTEQESSYRWLISMLEIWKCCFASHAPIPRPLIAF